MVQWKPPNINFKPRRFLACKEPKNTNNKGNFKIKFLLNQPKHIDVKNGGKVVKNMNVCRRTVYLAKMKTETIRKNKLTSVFIICQPPVLFT